MSSRLALIVGCVSLALLGTAPRAGASHFVKIDEQAVRQGPPEPAQLPGESPCIENSDFFGKGTFFNDQFAFADVGSFASLAGNCAGSETLSNTAHLLLNVIADPGDPEGPITLCFEARHSLSAESTADFTATAAFGNSEFPVTGPATITRSPGAISIFSDGPTTIHTGADANSQTGLFTVNGGDTITLDVGESSGVASGTSIGSATARGSARLSVRIGSCIGQGAPAVSHAGLGILVALLGGLGGLAVARRRPSGRHPDN